MTKPPAFQFYASDFLASTMVMTTMEVGAYIRALAHSWDCGALPKDEGKLSRMLQLTPDEFQVVWPTLRERFTETPKGYINKRLEVERKKQALYREKQANKGRASAQQRFNRSSTVVQPEGQPETGLRLQPEGNSPSPSPTPDLKREKTPRKKRADPVPCEGFDVFWQAYPLKVAKADAITAWNKLAPNEALRDFIGAALVWQRPTLTFEKDGQIKGTFPASWLNGKRWQDERPAIPTGVPMASALTVADVKLMARQLGPRSWAAECVNLHGGRCGGMENHDRQMAVAS